jgi:hypothetical protein
MAVKASLFLKQCFSVFIGEECCMVILPSWGLPSSTATASIDHIYIHRIVVALPALSFAFESLFPLTTCVTLQERICHCGFILSVCHMMCLGSLVPSLQRLWLRVCSFYDGCCKRMFQSPAKHENGALGIWLPPCSFLKVVKCGDVHV